MLANVISLETEEIIRILEIIALFFGTLTIFFLLRTIFYGVALLLQKHQHPEKYLEEQQQELARKKTLEQKKAERQKEKERKQLEKERKQLEKELKRKCSKEGITYSENMLEEAIFIRLKRVIRSEIPEDVQERLAQLFNDADDELRPGWTGSR